MKIALPLGLEGVAHLIADKPRVVIFSIGHQHQEIPYIVFVRCAIALRVRHCFDVTVSIEDIICLEVEVVFASVLDESYQAVAVVVIVLGPRAARIDHRGHVAVFVVAVDVVRLKTSGSALGLAVKFSIISVMRPIGSYSYFVVVVVASPRWVVSKVRRPMRSQA